MKRTLYTPIPFLFGLLLAGCQEQVAPELSNPAASGSGSSTTPTIVLPTVRNFSVSLTNTPTGVKPADLNYVIHKSYNGVTSTLEDCKMDVGTSTPSSLSPGSTDITCMVEAEEFALYYNGLTMEATATAGACDYITQEAFGYWRYQPGVSLRKNGTPRQVIYFDCEDEAKLRHPSSNVTGFGTYEQSTRTVSSVCGRYFNLSSSDTAIYGGLRISTPDALAGLEVTAKDDLCTFRHKTSKNEVINCDEGELLIHKVKLGSVNTAAPADPPVYALTQLSEGTEKFKCGGKVIACMGGAIRDHLTESDLEKGIRSRITPLPITGGSSSMAVPRSFPRFQTNLNAANFIRQCSAEFQQTDIPELYNVSSEEETFIFNSAGIDRNIPFGQAFDPSRVDYISKGTIDNNRDIEDASTQVDMRDARGFDQIILADDPLRAGLRMNSGFSLLTKSLWSVDFLKAQPFYKFTCYDKAFEPKGRISIAVREWNRNFDKSATAAFSFISDVSKRDKDFANNSLMDSGSAVRWQEYRFTRAGANLTILPDTADFTTNLRYNNLTDWDDFLKFSNNSNRVESACENFQTYIHTGKLAPAINTDTMMDERIFPIQSRSWFPGEFQ